MKVKVTQEFEDKHTGQLHRVGDEMDVPVSRVNEILSVGAFILIVEESPLSPETPDNPENTDTTDAPEAETARVSRSSRKKTS